LRGKVLVAEGYKGNFCEKLREVFPMSDKASARQLSDGLATALGQANQRWWQRLCDNIFKKGKKKNCGEVAVRREE